MNENLDVGTILAQLRAEVRAAHGLRDAATAHAALGVDVTELRESIAEVEALRAVSVHWPLQWRTPRERVLVFAQRIIRRALRFYLEPIVQQQNNYNAAVARALELLLSTDEHRLARMGTEGRDKGDADGMQMGKDAGNVLGEQGSQTPTSPAFPLLELHDLQPTLREASVVIGQPALIGRTPYERLWALINRALRRVAVHAVAPVVAQQNEWNAATLHALHGIARLSAALHGIETARLARIAAMRSG